MPGERATDQTLTVRGEGATAADALRSLVAACIAAMLNDAGGPGDQAAVVRASAATLERLIPDFIGAMLAACEDFGLDLTDASLDGLIATDDGWRAWGTISGLPLAGSPVSAWRPGAATVEERPGSVIMRLSLQREPANG